MNKKNTKKLLIASSLIIPITFAGAAFFIINNHTNTNLDDQGIGSNETEAQDKNDSEAADGGTTNDEDTPQSPSNNSDSSSDNSSDSSGGDVGSSPSSSSSSNNDSDDDSPDENDGSRNNSGGNTPTFSPSEVLGIPAQSSGTRTGYLHYLIIGGETLRSFYGYHNDPAFSGTYTVEYIQNELATDNFQYRATVGSTTRYFVRSDIDSLANTYDQLVAGNRSNPDLNKVIFDNKSFLNFYDEFKGYISDPDYGKFIPGFRR